MILFFLSKHIDPGKLLAKDCFAQGSAFWSFRDWKYSVIHHYVSIDNASVQGCDVNSKELQIQIQIQNTFIEENMHPYTQQI